jgi:hypothetical protein
LDAPTADLKPPVAVIAAGPSRREGWEVLEALGFAGKHLDTLPLETVKDTDELAVGLHDRVTLIAGQHLVRRLLERPRGLEEKLLKAFPFGKIVVARVWERGYGYALFERGEKIRHRVVALGEVLVDEGELLDEEEGLYDGPAFDPEGEPLEDTRATELGGRIALMLLAQVHEAPLKGVEMDLYEGPPR